jgi:hypothetical protein
MSEPKMNRHEIEQEIKQYQVREQTKANQEKAGLPIPPKPDNAENLYIEWENIKKKYGGMANIPFSELGDFLDRWTGLVSYARWVEAIADIDLATAREIRDTIKKQLYTLQEGGREIRDALVHNEPLYREWEKKFTEANAMYIATKALREGYEVRANAISREITRRTMDMQDNRRAINRGNTI